MIHHHEAPFIPLHKFENIRTRKKVIELMKDFLCPFKRDDTLYMFYKENGQRCGDEQIVELPETNQVGSPLALFTARGQRVYDFRAIFKYHQ